MIWVIGIGEDGLAGLAESARARVEGAEVLVGGRRHLDFVADFDGATLDWSGGIDAGLDRIADYENDGKAVCVLASGDPLYFGVAKNLIERFGPDHVTVIPHPGAVSLTCAAMGWSQPDVQVVTVHGRALESLNRYLTPGQRLVVLSHDGDTPARVARLLSERGFGDARLSVWEHLGGAKQKRHDAIAETWAHGSCAALNTIAIELGHGPRAQAYSRLAGLPDDAFEHDGQLTKRHVRAVTLSSLAPLPGETLWDLGAGAGSISIEWMRAHESCHAVAVERDPLRAERIVRNALALGTPRLVVEVCASSDALKSLDGQPDAIFIGGGVAEQGLLAAAWARLKPGGRLVANAVTESGAAALAEFQKNQSGELTQIAIKNKQNKNSLFENKAPITQYIGIKPLNSLENES